MVRLIFKPSLNKVLPFKNRQHVCKSKFLYLTRMDWLASRWSIHLEVGQHWLKSIELSVVLTLVALLRWQCRNWWWDHSFPFYSVSCALGWTHRNGRCTRVGRIVSSSAHPLATSGEASFGMRAPSSVVVCKAGSTSTTDSSRTRKRTRTCRFGCPSTFVSAAIAKGFAVDRNRVLAVCTVRIWLETQFDCRCSPESVPPAWAWVYSSDQIRHSHPKKQKVHRLSKESIG